MILILVLSINSHPCVRVVADALASLGVGVNLAVVLPPQLLTLIVPHSNDRVLRGRLPLARVKLRERDTCPLPLAEGVSVVGNVRAVHMGAATLEETRALSCSFSAWASLPAVLCRAADLAHADLHSAATALAATGPQSELGHLAIHRACLFVANSGLLKRRAFHAASACLPHDVASSSVLATTASLCTAAELTPSRHNAVNRADMLIAMS